jgi:protein-disulfide isomerase
VSTARRRAWQLGAAAAFAAIVAVVLALVLNASTSVELGELPQQSHRVERLFAGLPQRGFELGNRAAPATLVEFADPQCPFCGKFARETLPEIVRRYVRAGLLRLRLELLTFLGEDSDRIGGLAAAATLQHRGFEVLELAYENQGDEGSRYATDAYLRRIAQATPGLDAASALRQASSPGAQRVLERADRAASRLAVKATPAFYVEQRGNTPQELKPSELTPDAFAAALRPFVGSLDDR